MKIPGLIFAILAVVVAVGGCKKINNEENEPDLNLAGEFGLDTSQLVYQYYQKFGFTDACEDIRMVSILKNAPQFKKTLPITKNDLITINEFPNKVDSIDGSQISFDSNTRDQFLDIELDFIEFTSNSLLNVKLTNGTYEIIQTELTSTLKVFDKESGLLYIESHRCDGS